MFEDDPDVYEPISLSPDEVPVFTGGKDILSQIEDKIKRKEYIDDVINAPDDMVSFFGKVFPEIQLYHNAGLNTSDDMKFWREGGNSIEFEVDTSPTVDGVERWDVWVGGPATLFGAVLQARSEDPGNLLYAHDGVRGVSNWKGSVCTYIHRDSMPLYYYSQYSAPRIVYTTLRDHVHRMVNYAGYVEKLKTDPYWSTLRVSFYNILTSPSLMWMSVRNQVKSVLDVGIYLPGTAILPPHKTTAHTSFPHVCLTPTILRELDLGYTVQFENSEKSMLLLGTFGKEKKKPRFIDSERRLKQIIGPANFTSVSKEELAARGYNTDFVIGAQTHPRDGGIRMACDEAMERDIVEHGGEVRPHSRLVKILVRPVGEGDCEVSRVVWEDSRTGEQSTTAVSRLYLCLGPSMDRLSVGRVNLMERIMCAAAASNVLLVRVDKSVVPEQKLTRFRDMLGYSNKIYYRLGEREVRVGDKNYHYFAMQCSGGGMFPSKHPHAEVALNTIKAVVGPSLGLESEGVEFEIVSVRGCARGVTAQNFMRLAAPAANMVMMYGLGGTGMANMVPNGALLSAVMRQRQLLAAGDISMKEFRNNMTHSSFDKIPALKSGNPFKGNYYQFFDVKTHKTVARTLFGGRCISRIMRSIRFLK